MPYATLVARLNLQFASASGAFDYFKIQSFAAQFAVQCPCLSACYMLVHVHGHHSDASAQYKYMACWLAVMST